MHNLNIETEWYFDSLLSAYRARVILDDGVINSLYFIKNKYDLIKYLDMDEFIYQFFGYYTGFSFVDGNNINKVYNLYGNNDYVSINPYFNLNDNLINSYLSARLRLDNDFIFNNNQDLSIIIKTVLDTTKDINFFYAGAGSNPVPGLWIRFLKSSGFVSVSLGNGVSRIILNSSFNQNTEFSIAILIKRNDYLKIYINGQFNNSVSIVGFGELFNYSVNYYGYLNETIVSPDYYKYSMVVKKILTDDEIQYISDNL